jgi:hypothetical protein
VKDRVWVNNKRLRGSVEEEEEEGKQQKTEVGCCLIWESVPIVFYWVDVV